MKVRPLVTYISFMVASFAVTLGAVAQADTFGVRYPAASCNQVCGFDTGSAFPTSSGSLTQVLVDYFVVTATSEPDVQLCNATTTTVNCSATKFGSGAQGGQQIAIEAPGDNTMLGFWEDDSKFTYLIFVREASVSFEGYKVSGN